ncbi:Protein MMS22-like [Mortierella polycephala]|uniref:Protein MMS22-like n=1 Tax=Mortierella polycephala TaxID=41804 RepID=A0A9P6QHD3_9FUNG|nr:Protein MMS22-like [Mortierella polycephala]
MPNFVDWQTQQQPVQAQHFIRSKDTQNADEFLLELSCVENGVGFIHNAIRPRDDNDNGEHTDIGEPLDDPLQVIPASQASDSEAELWTNAHPIYSHNSVADIPTTVPFPEPLSPPMILDFALSLSQTPEEEHVVTASTQLDTKTLQEDRASVTSPTRTAPDHVNIAGILTTLPFPEPLSPPTISNFLSSPLQIFDERHAATESAQLRAKTAQEEHPVVASSKVPLQTAQGQHASAPRNLPPADTMEQQGNSGISAHTPLSDQQSKYTMKKSYPLRERTFQQRKPYTADKQQHARFIGSRIGSSRSSGPLTREDLAILNHQDDEEDSDYEEQGPQPSEATPHVERRHPPKKTSDMPRDIVGMDLWQHDLDDDELPTVEQLRLQFRSGERSYSQEPNMQVRTPAFPPVRIPTSLSAKARRKFERMAQQTVEPLEPVDVEPQMPYSPHRQPNVNRRLVRKYGTHKQSISAPSTRTPSPQASPMETIGEFDLAMDDDIIQPLTSGSSSEAGHTQPSAKAAKRHRQHVLPAVFFKRNMLPDDAAALRSMRSRISRSESPSEVANSDDPEPVQLPHHAKRRIAPTNHHERGLEDFIAQLAGERSASENESDVGVASDVSREVDHSFTDNRNSITSSIRSASWRTRPTLKDTVASDHDMSSYKSYGHIDYGLSADDMVYSESEVQGLQRERSYENENWYTQPASSAPSKRSKNRGPASRGERLDMIDRMIVRSSNGTRKPNQQTIAPRSTKRRRISGSLTSTKIRHSVYGPSKATFPSNRLATSNHYRGRRQSSAETDTVEVEQEDPTIVSDGYSDESSLDDFMDRAERYNAGYNDRNGNYIHGTGDYDVDSDLTDSERAPLMILKRTDARRRLARVHSTPKRNTSKPRYRALCHSKVIPRTRISRPAQESTVHQRRPRVPQIKQRKQATKARGTMQSQLTSWYHQHPAQSRPQFVNKPVFQPAARSRRLERDQEGVASSRSNPSPQEHPESVRQTRIDDIPDEITMQDQPWDDVNQDGLDSRLRHGSLPAPMPHLSIQPNNPIAAGIAVAQDTQGSKGYFLRDTPIPNGLYFSRDTYIGRGMFSQLLKGISYKTMDYLMASRAEFQAVFFGRPFAPQWEDPSSLDSEWSCVVLELQQHFRNIMDSTRGFSMDNWRDGSHERSDVRACLRALEDLTVLLMERITISSGANQVAIWRSFLSKVIQPLIALTDASTSYNDRSLVSVLTLWVRWALVTWIIAADCILPAELVEQTMVDSMIQSLLSQLVESSDGRFFAQLAELQDVARTSAGAIHSQDVLEVWVCLIRLLDHSAEIRFSQGFWMHFNLYVRQSWLKERTPVNLGEGPVVVDAWQDRADHCMSLMQQLCRLHQFERDGSSNANIRVKENWELVLWLLRNNWLEGTMQNSPEGERHLRRFLVFCHSRHQIWNWTPCIPAIVHVYRYFADRGFRDMPTERGYRLPEFLKRMIATSNPVRMPTGPDDESLNPSSDLGSNMTLVDAVDDYDRCFEIFLKVLAKTIRWLVSAIFTHGQAQDLHATPGMVSQGDLGDGTTSFQAPTYQALSKAEQIKVCMRFLSSISPAIVTTVSSSGPSEQSYSSLCNPCNLVLTVALLVPDSIRPSTVGQLRSLLNFEGSDNAARRILLESVFYLGTVWQRGESHGMVGDNGRSIDKILDFFFGRIDSMCLELEADLATMDSDASYVSRSKRQAPVAALIETTTGYIIQLLNSERSSQPGQPVQLSLSFLDKRLSRFFNPDVRYSPELRLQALGVVESFLALRAHILKDLAQASKQLTSHTQGQTVEVNQAKDRDHNSKVLVDDGFSSFEYEHFAFDDSDLFESSQTSEKKGSTTPVPTILGPGISTKTLSTDAAISLPMDNDLAKIILSWIYPSLMRLLQARHQALQEEQSRPTFSVMPVPKQVEGRGFAAHPNSAGFAPSDHSVLTRPSNITSMSLQGVWRILGVYADCSVILVDLSLMKMDEITSVFKREAWLSPWIQHWRLQDELVWATRIAECSPRMILAHEDIFLNIWFGSISSPVHELTVQHRLLHAILNFSDSAEAEAAEHSGSNSILSRYLFKDLPIAHLDYVNPYSQELNGFKENANVHRSLMNSNQDARLFQEFKEARLQLLAKVLSNIGEHYLVVRPAPGSDDQRLFYIAHSVKTRLQAYLGLLLNQVKKDYERLESRKMVKETLKHVELAHHIVGHVIQHCGLVMQNSQLTGPHDSVLNFLTSSRFFPQPRMDGVYIHQRIRGYAYLYQAGERQFFRDLLQMVMTHLKLIPGHTGFRLDWRICSLDQAAVATPGTHVSFGSEEETVLNMRLGLRVMDGGTAVYEVKPQPKVIDQANDRSLATARGMTGTIPRLFGMQSEQGSAQGIFGANGNLTGPSRKPPATDAGAQGTKTSIGTLFANQVIKQKTPQHLSKEALLTLTSSLRNVALEAESRKQWNAVVSSFRTMAFVSIFRPLLTAFLGPDGRRGYCATSVSAAGGITLGQSIQSSLPQRPSLMALAVPTLQWLVSLVGALASDIESLEKRSVETLAAGTRIPAPTESPVLKAYEGFQKETSLLFSSLLQCLVGALGLISTRWIEIIRVRLGEMALRENEAPDVERLSDDDKNAVKAVHLCGEVLQALRAIIKVARKIQTEHGDFYDRNASWKEALLELCQFAFDKSLNLMMAMGGPTIEHRFDEDEPMTADDSVMEPRFRSSVADSPFMETEWAAADRFPGSLDAVSLESSFLDFLSGHSHSAQFEEQVARELSNLQTLQDWAGDIFSANADPAVASFASGDASETRLKKHHKALWSFQSSFLDYCRSISMLDPRFHRQVQRALDVLLRPPSYSASNVLEPLFQRAQKWDSVWYQLVHIAPDPSHPRQPATSWVILRWCMSQEWRVFLAECGMAVPVPGAPASVHAPGVSMMRQDSEHMRPNILCVDSIFV